MMTRERSLVRLFATDALHRVYSQVVNGAQIRVFDLMRNLSTTIALLSLVVGGIFALSMDSSSMGWQVALALFALISLAYLVYVLWLAISGNTRRLDERFAPRSSREELQEELDDLQKRMSGNTQAESGATPSDGSAPRRGAQS